MLTFDAHEYVKNMTETWIPEAQAEVHAQNLKKMVEGELATKRDIEALRLATKQDIAEVKHDIEMVEIRLKQDSTLRLGSMMFIGIGAVATLVKLL